MRRPLMLRLNFDACTTPIRRTRSAAPTRQPSRAVTRAAWTAQANHTAVLQSEPSERSAIRLPEWRPGHALGGSGTVDHVHARRIGAVHDRRIPRSDLFGHQVQFADTLSWRRGSTTCASAAACTSHIGGTGSEPGHGVLGTFQFLNTTTAPFDQLTLADVQQHAADQLRGHQLRPDSSGCSWGSFRTTSGERMTSRSIRAPLRPPDADGLDERTSRRASASAGIRRAIRGSRFAAATGCTTRRFVANALANSLTGGLDGLTTYRRRRPARLPDLSRQARAFRCSSIRTPAAVTAAGA